MNIRFIYPSPMAAELARVERGEAPTDRMYGLIELRKAGHHVHFSDSRFEGRFNQVRRALRPVSNLMDRRSLRGLGKDDVVVVKDEFSTMLTMAGRGAGTPVVYLDAMFGFPRRFWRKAATRLNLAVAEGHIVYSRGQIALWSERYRLAENRLAFLPYCIDMAFYRRAERRQVRPYVLSVGRDLGRDFSTLVKSMEGAGLDLKVVTLPYTLTGIDVTAPWIEILQHVSYPDLFQLYADAALVVIPLKAGMTYPSGIRGLLEALALGAPTICTRTPVLSEYVPEGEGVTYVDAGDLSALRTAIVALAGDGNTSTSLADRGPAFVRPRFDMPVFVAALERFLAQVVRPS